MRKTIEMTFLRSNIRITHEVQPYTLTIYYELPSPNTGEPFVVTKQYFDMPDLLKDMKKISEKEEW